MFEGLIEFPKAGRVTASFRPRLERVEERIVCSVTSYTETVTVINSDNTTQSVTETFNWDLADSNYQSTLDGIGSMSYCLNSVQYTNSMVENGPSTPYGYAVDNLTSSLDSYWSQAASTMPALSSLMSGLNDQYTDPSTGVRIDSSVTDNATAKARVAHLTVLVDIAADRAKVILDDIRSSGTIGQCAKTVWYRDEIKSLTNQLKSYSAELKLIRSAYPGAFQ